MIWHFVNIINKIKCILVGFYFKDQRKVASQLLQKQEINFKT